MVDCGDKDKDIMIVVTASQNVMPMSNNISIRNRQPFPVSLTRYTNPQSKRTALILFFSRDCFSVFYSP